MRAIPDLAKSRRRAAPADMWYSFHPGMRVSSLAFIIATFAENCHADYGRQGCLRKKGRKEKMRDEGKEKFHPFSSLIHPLSFSSGPVFLTENLHERNCTPPARGIPS